MALVLHKKWITMTSRPCISGSRKMTTLSPCAGFEPCYFVFLLPIYFPKKEDVIS